MPTRKELLENLEYEMERLTEAQQYNSDALQRYNESQIQSSEGIERAAEHHGEQLIKASKNIESAGDSILAGLVGGAAILVGGIASLFVGGVTLFAIKLLLERIKETNKKTDIIKSFINLQSIYPYLTYNFVIDRSYAESTNREERQNLINQLISEGIITNYKYGKHNSLRIDEDNPKLLEYWKWLDEVRHDVHDAIEKVKSEG
jgi:hypothetical protein